MTKFSVIIPHFSRQFYLTHCIDSLLNQTYEDFEIIVVGEKIAGVDTKTQINGIDINCIEFDDYKKPSEMLNLAVKSARGEYIQFLQCDFTLFPNHMHKLYFYTKTYGIDNLYTGRVLDSRNIEVLEYRNNFFIPYYHYADRLDACVHKSQVLPFFEGFTGIGSHFYVEWLARMWQKVVFICLKDLEIVHIPHRSPYKEREVQARASNILYQKCANLDFDYSRYNELQKEVDDLYKAVKSVNLEGYEINGFLPKGV